MIKGPISSLLLEIIWLDTSSRSSIFDVFPSLHALFINSLSLYLLLLLLLLLLLFLLLVSLLLLCSLLLTFDITLRNPKWFSFAFMNCWLRISKIALLLLLDFLISEFESSPPPLAPPPKLFLCPCVELFALWKYEY